MCSKLHVSAECSFASSPRTDRNVASWRGWETLPESHPGPGVIAEPMHLASVASRWPAARAPGLTGGNTNNVLEQTGRLPLN